ncbi:MAG: RsmE family RNA methyltransferase, partial [Actinomycetota bacterium]|nr:RsmE family RNA methyltransferase [Actinomycetota bacterium]
MAGAGAGEGGAAAHVVVGDLDHPVLDPEDAHHLKAVLRLRPGEAVGTTDGRGGFRPCVWSGGSGLEPAGDVDVDPPRLPVLSVGFVPVKGDRPDWTVQKLTELGVDRIVVLSSERSVVRWEGERLGPHLARLSRVARAAVMQSRQVWLPSVEWGGAVSDLLVAGLSGSAGLSGLSGLAVADMG